MTHLLARERDTRRTARLGPNFLQRRRRGRCRSFVQLDDDLARPRAGAVHDTIKVAVLLGLLATLAILAAGPNAAWPRYYSPAIHEHLFRYALAAGFVIAIILLWLPRPRTSYAVRFAVALPIVHLVAIACTYFAWRALRDDLHDATQSISLLLVLPVDITLGLLVTATAIGGRIAARPRRREWLHATVMLALVHLLLLGLWLPFAAHFWHGDTFDRWLAFEAAMARPTTMMVFVIVPPLTGAALVTAIAMRRPHVLRHPLVLIPACAGVLVAVVMRAHASETSALVYINFVHVLVAAAAVAIAALIALGIASWAGAVRARQALAASTLVGTIDAAPDEAVATLRMGWLRGPATVATAFSVHTQHGEVPVPAGAYVVAPTSLASTVLRGGEVLAVLRGGDRVVLAGYERGGDGGPFRASTVPVPGARGVRIGIVGAERHGLHHVALDLWRPSLAYLLICVVVALPALAALVSDRL